MKHDSSLQEGIFFPYDGMAQKRKARSEERAFRMSWAWPLCGILLRRSWHRRP